MSLFHHFRNATLLTTAILVASLASTPVAAQSILSAPHDYFFGDSDLEQGNFQIIAGQTAADRTPYYCAGGLCRDSNGPVWPELFHPGVQAALAAKPDAPALNFAVSGAHMTERGDSDLPAPTGVVTQIARFAAFQDSGEVIVHPQDRFFIHAGSNDLIRLLQGDAPNLVKTQIVEAATANVATLASRGAKTIVLAQVQPVQYLPLLAGNENQGLRDALGGFIADTNAAMKASLARVKPILAAGTNIVVMDQTAFFERLRSHYAELGFTKIDTPCYDAAAGTLCATDPTAQNHYAFFDTNHFTAAGHALLADWYRATLDAVSGEASRTAGRIPDVLLSHGDRVHTETRATRALMAGDGNRPFLFAAPFSIKTRLQKDGLTGKVAHVRQHGGLVGAQVPLGKRSFAALSFAGLDDEVRIGAVSGFNVREWSVTLLSGFDLGPAWLTVHGDYAPSNIRDFHRDTEALGVVAAGHTRAQRWSAGADLAAEQRFGPIRLQSRTGLDYTQVRVKGFSEGDADGLALRYDDQRAAQWVLDAYLKASLDIFSPWNRASILPFVHMRNRTRLGGASHDVRSVLIANIADPASIRTRATDNDRLEIGGGVDIRLGRAMAIGVAYDRAVAGSERSGALSLRLAYRF